MKNKTVLISTHYGVVQCLHSIITGTPIRKAMETYPENTGILMVEISGRNHRITKERMFR